MINSKTGITGIFGWPVGHSLSPAMQNAAIGRAGLNYAYIPVEVKPGSLGRAVDSIRVLNFRGVNITVPHKENIIKHLDGVSAAAKKIGAVNTIVNNSGKLIGHNTDWKGFLRSLKEHTQPRGKSVFMLGCGGAAKAVFYALCQSGAKEITVSDVDAKKAENLKKSYACGGKVNSVSAKKAGNALRFADIFINATPVGMNAKDGAPVEKKFLRKGLFVFDVVYNRPTVLSRYAAEAGAEYVNGLDMLVYQGAESFELWFGKKPDLKLMKKIVREELK